MLKSVSPALLVTWCYFVHNKLYYLEPVLRNNYCFRISEVVIMPSAWTTGLLPFCLTLCSVWIVVFYTSFGRIPTTPLPQLRDFDMWWSAQDTWRIKQVKLKENIAHVCDKYNLNGRNHLNPRQLFHVPELNLLYCENHKVCALQADFISTSTAHVCPLFIILC